MYNDHSFSTSSVSKIMHNNVNFIFETNLRASPERNQDRERYNGSLIVNGKNKLEEHV